jgi:hypothetical protein
MLVATIREMSMRATSPGRPADPLPGRVAHLAEQLTFNQRVLGSSPSAPTKKIKQPAPQKLPLATISGRPPAAVFNRAPYMPPS